MAIKKPHDTESLLIQMFKQYFQIHTAIEKTELLFLVLGVIYFTEAIIKNTIEMLRGIGH